MYSRMTRLASLVALVAAVTLGAGAALAQQAPSVSCSAGRLQVSIQWADAHVSVLCSTDQVQDSAPTQVVGMIVRWSDGTMGTIGVSDAASGGLSSITTSSSTTCINGQCTSTHTESVCVDSSCSAS